MKILFWNCRGLGRPRTQAHLKNQIHAHGPDVVLLSETFAHEKTASRLAHRSGFQSFYVQPPEGRRNGFLLLWSNNVSISVLFSTNWLIELQFSFRGKTCYILFLHADSRKDVQERQWRLIESISHRYEIPWIIIGDFNAMLNQDEKRGGIPLNRRQVEGFASFIERCNLCEIPIKGPQFTWCNGQQGLRRISEKIDRGFAHPDFFDLFPSPLLYSQSINGSDHCPMILDMIREPTDRCKPFRFEALWFEEETCAPVVTKFWRSQHSQRPFSHKLQGLAWELKRWNRKTVGNIHSKLQQINNQLIQVQEALSITDDPYLQTEEKRLQQEYNKLLSQQEIFWYQKSRVNWLKWGDRNTSFFHKSTLIRRQKNFIYSLRTSDNVEISERSELKSHVLNYFQSVFRKQPRWTSFELTQLLPKYLSEVHNSILSQVPTHVEIWNTVKAMPPLKAPGPDGYPTAFFQKFWDLVGEDVVKLIQDFFHNAHMPESLNHTFIALIPKVTQPRTLNQYRPISLCNVAYKIISKIISNRLRPILANIISPNQTAFVPGRHIWDNILLHHEVCHYFHKTKKASKTTRKKNNGKKKGCFALKLDFTKAYDRIDWDFLCQVLKAYGFSNHNISLIMACVNTVTYSVLLNGSPVGYFKAQRGLRQGDPISPYLFILCQQVLSSAINRAELDHRIHGIKLSRSSPSLTHLMFADDIILYGHCVDREAHCLLRLLHKYCAESGQEINFQKSSIRFSNSATRQHRTAIKHIFNVKGAPPHDKYLGIPVLHNKPTHKDCQQLIERASARLAGWKSFLLSQMGKVTLIQSVLSSQANHFMSCFSLPKSILNKLDALARQFYWKKGKDAYSFMTMCWDQITLSWRQGGLNIKKPELMNKALLLKLAWNLQTMQSGLWSQFMKGIYFPNTSFLEAKFKKGQSFAWKQLQQLKDYLRKGITWVIANGQQINTFMDSWLLQGELIQQPQPQCQEISLSRVSQLMSPSANCWNFDLLSKLWPSHVVAQILSTPISPLLQEDKQVWKLTARGDFSVASAYRLLLGNLLSNDESFWLRIWHLPSLPRCKFFLWKSLHRKIPTGELVCQRLQKENNACPLCSEAPESVEHFWLRCPFSRAVWLHTIGGSTQSVGDCTSFVNWFKSLSQLKSFDPNFNLTIFLTYVSIFGWVLWNHRNKVLFEAKKPDVFAVIKHFKSLSAEVDSLQQEMEDSNLNNQNIQVHWSPPPEDYVKVNFDGAFKRSTGEGAIGVIIRSSTGMFLGATATKCKASKAIYAEASAALEALKLAAARGFKNIILEGDSLVLINILNGTYTHHPWQISPILDQIKSIWSVFANIQVIHILREGNRLADMLANHAIDQFSCTWVSKPPAFLYLPLLDEARGQLFVRKVKK